MAPRTPVLARSTRSSSSSAWTEKRDRPRRDALRRPAAPAGPRAGSPATPSSCSSTSPRPASTRPRAVSAWELIDGLRSLDKTILLTTHYMDEAAAARRPRRGDRRWARSSPRGRRRPSRVASSAPPSSASAFARDVGVEELPLGAGRRPTRANGRVSFRTASADARSRAADPWALGAGPRARGPHCHPAVARGRLPRAHRAGGGMIAERPARPTSRCCAAGCVARVRLDPARRPVRRSSRCLPARAARPAQRDLRRQHGQRPRREGRLRPVLHAVDRDLRALRSPATRRRLHPRCRARGRDPQARTRDACEPEALPERVARAAILIGLAAMLLLFAVAVPAFGVDLYPRLLPAAVVTAFLGAAPWQPSASRSRRSSAGPTSAGDREPDAVPAQLPLGRLLPARRARPNGWSPSRASSPSATSWRRSPPASARIPRAAASPFEISQSSLPGAPAHARRGAPLPLGDVRAGGAAAPPVVRARGCSAAGGPDARRPPATLARDRRRLGAGRLEDEPADEREPDTAASRPMIPMKRNPAAIIAMPIHTPRRRRHDRRPDGVPRAASQRVERSTRPPSSGRAGSRLKASRTRLM